ncbi:MAG: hypothetical protein U5R48_01215 [Gammaproteobacteria bacterium]|nr:hypothetical protein [Gammaproteobacteria bacterium]
MALFIGAALFWSGFEQAGSSLNLFADRYAARAARHRHSGRSLSVAEPAVYPDLCALLSALWIQPGRLQPLPVHPVEVRFGFLQLGLGFGFMWMAASLIQDGGQVLPTWLLLTYLFHTTAELCLSPIGLSATSKLAPRRYYSQLMGMCVLRCRARQPAGRDRGRRIQRRGCLRVSRNVSARS